MPNLTDREEFVIAKALALAIEAIKRLPEVRRPHSDMADMETLLAHYGGNLATIWRTKAQAMLTGRSVTVENGEFVLKARASGSVVPLRG